MTKMLDIVKCVLNSDVFFKSIARIIEAFQTHDRECIKATLQSERPLWIDECKKCKGEE